MKSYNEWPQMSNVKEFVKQMNFTISVLLFGFRKAGFSSNLI